MSKAQGFILAALLLVAVVNIASDPGGFATGFGNVFGHIGGAQAVQPSKFALYWIGAVVALVLLADASPVVAGWLAALILVGTLLTKGQAAFGGKKQ